MPSDGRLSLWHWQYHRLEQQDIVRIEHCRIGNSTMRFPDGPAVKSGKRGLSRRHIGKPTDPDEAIGIVEITERADDIRAECLLWCNEVLFEKRNQRIALTSV